MISAWIRLQTGQTKPNKDISFVPHSVLGGFFPSADNLSCLISEEEFTYWRLLDRTKFQDHPEVEKFQQAMRFKLMYFPLSVAAISLSGLLVATSIFTRRSTARYLALFKQHGSVIESKNMLSLKDVDKEAYQFFKKWPQEKMKNPQADIYEFIQEKVKMKNAITVIGFTLAIYTQLYDLGIYNLRTDIYKLRHSGVDRDMLEYEQKEYFHPMPDETVLPVQR